MKTSRARILCVILFAASLLSCSQTSRPTPELSKTPLAQEPVILATPSPTVQPEKGEIGPGLLKDKDGNTHQCAGDLHFVVLDTNKWGQAMVASWPNLQPKVDAMFLEGKQNFWDGAAISFLAEDFIKFTPKSPLDPSMVVSSSITAVPTAGIAYIDKTGAILISLTKAEPPAGFQLLGPASIKVSVLERWREHKEGLTVLWATDLRI